MIYIHKWDTCLSPLTYQCSDVIINSRNTIRYAQIFNLLCIQNLTCSHI